MSFSREQQEILEVYGFDLMVQIEAMLRHVREYQRALQQLRGTLPRSNPATPVAAIMQKHIGGLRGAMKEFESSLREIEAHAATAPSAPSQAADERTRDGSVGGS